MLKQALNNLHLFAQTLASANSGNVEDWRLLNLKEQLKIDSEINYKWNHLRIRDDIYSRGGHRGCHESPRDIYEDWRNTSIQDIQNNHKKKIRDKNDLFAYDDVKRHLVIDKNLQDYNTAIVMDLDKIYNDPRISNEKKNLIKQKINITTSENGKTRVIRPGDHITSTGKKSDSEMMKMLEMRKEYTSDIETLEEEWKYYLEENDPFALEKAKLGDWDYSKTKPHLISSVLWKYWFESGLIDTDIYYGGATADGKYIYTLYIRQLNTMNNNLDNTYILRNEMDHRKFQLPMVFFSDIRPDAKGFEKLLLQTFATQIYYEFNFPAGYDVFTSKMSYYAKDDQVLLSNSHADVYFPVKEMTDWWLNSSSEWTRKGDYKKRVFLFYDKFSWCDMLNVNLTNDELHWWYFPLMIKPRYEKIYISISRLSKQTLEMGYITSEPSYLEKLFERWFGLRISKFEGDFTVKAGELLKAVKEKFKDNPKTFLLFNHLTTLKPWDIKFWKKQNFEVNVVPKFESLSLDDSIKLTGNNWLQVDWIEEKTNTSFKKEPMFSAPYEWVRDAQENMGSHEEVEFDIFRKSLLNSNKDLTVGFSEKNSERISILQKKGLEIADLYFEIDVMVADLLVL